MTRGAATIGLFALLAGCSFAAPSDGRRNTCHEDSDCGPGGRCGADAMCVSTRAASLEFEVLPPPIAAMPGFPQRIGGANTTGFDNLELTLADPVDLYGAVRAPGVSGDYSAGVPARITIEMLDHIPGVEARITASALGAPVDPGQSLDGDDMTWRSPVVPHHMYLLTIVPADDASALVPPLRRRVEVGDASMRVDFVYPDRLEVYEGRIVAADGAAGAPGLTVRATDPTTGARASTTSVTDERGAFRLVLSPDAPENLSFSISSTDSGSVVPSLAADEMSFAPDGAGRATLRLPATDGRVCYSGTVVGATRTGAVLPAVAATVTFANTGLGDARHGIHGTLQISVTTDDAGHFDANLLASDEPYEVSIVPVAEGDLGVLVQHVMITQRPAAGGCVMGQEFQLPARIALGGRVLAPDATPLPDVALQAIPTTVPSSTITSAAERLARPASGATDASGAFRLVLDPGAYDLEIRVPASTGLPWTVVRDLEVRTSAASFDVTLPAPVPIAGFVRDPLMAGVAGATVDVYTVEQSPDSPPRAWLVATARTDDTGAYRLLAPSTLVRN